MLSLKIVIALLTLASTLDSLEEFEEVEEVVNVLLFPTAAVELFLTLVDEVDEE